VARCARGIPEHESSSTVPAACRTISRKNHTAARVQQMTPTVQCSHAVRTVCDASLPCDNRICDFIDLKGWITMQDLHLFNGSNSLKCSRMFVTREPNALMHGTPLLDATIDCLVPGSGCAHLLFVAIAVGSTWDTHARITSMAFVCNNLFTTTKQSFQARLEHLQIRPRAGLKGSIVSNDPASVDADCHFATKTRPIKLVRTPSRRPRRGLWDQKVHTINGNKTALSSVPSQPVLPLCLREKKQQSK